MKRKQKLFIFTMLAYPVLHFLVFTVFVNYQTVVYSFKRWNVYTGKIEWVNWDNYRKVFELIGEDPVYRYAVQNTLLWIPLNVLVLLPLSIVVGYVLSQKVRFHSFYRAVYFLPTIISIVIMTMVFSFATSPIIGIVNPLLGWIGLDGWQRSWLGDMQTALPTVFFFCVWAGIGFYATMIMGAIARIPQEIFEVGKLEGLSKRKELVQVIVPMIWPNISALILIGTSSAFTIFLQSKLLTGGGPNSTTNTVALQITVLIQKGDYGLASALGIMLILVGFGITYAVKYALDRKTVVEY